MRTFLAKEFYRAPRLRTGVVAQVVGAGATVDISALIPTKDTLRLYRAPWVRMIACYNNAGTFAMPLYLSVSDNGVSSSPIPFLQSGVDAVHALVGGLDVQGVPSSRTLSDGFITWGRDAATGLVTDPTGDIQTPYLTNSSGAPITVMICFEIPVLAQDTSLTRLRAMDEYNHAPTFTRVMRASASLAAATTIELTSVVPTVADVDGAPYVDIFVGSAFTGNGTFESGVLGAIQSANAPTVFPYAPGRALLDGGSGGVPAILFAGIQPRATAAATTLPDGTRIFVRNTTAATGIETFAYARVPSLNWE